MKHKVQVRVEKALKRGRDFEVWLNVAYKHSRVELRIIAGNVYGIPFIRKRECFALCVTRAEQSVPPPIIRSDAHEHWGDVMLVVENVLTEVCFVRTMVKKDDTNGPRDEIVTHE